MGSYSGVYSQGVYYRYVPYTNLRHRQGCRCRRRSLTVYEMAPKKPGPREHICV